MEAPGQNVKGTRDCPAGTGEVGEVIAWCAFVSQFLAMRHVPGKVSKPLAMYSF